MNIAERYLALTLGVILASPVWSGTVAVAEESADHEGYREHLDGRVGKREQRYGRIDTDNDGSLSADERANAAANRERIDRNDDGQIDRRERGFNRADRNKDGELGPRERQMRHIDSNRDGYVNRREARHASAQRQQSQGQQSRDQQSRGRQGRGQQTRHR